MAWQRWIGVGMSVGVICALISGGRQQREKSLDVGNPLGRLSERREVRAPVEPDFSGLNLLRFDLRAETVTTPLTQGRTAELTLDPDLQRSTLAVMKRYALPEAGAVLMDTKTGNLLVYASQVREREPFDVNLRAEAPAASIFKIVTAASLLETSSLNAQTEQCYHGGQSRIVADDLREDPARDRSCASLASALGRSVNVVFARLATRYLSPQSLTHTASAFGFGAPTPFDVVADAPGIALPADNPLEFARAAAGFWHTTLSPLAAASIAQTVAGGGVAVKPRIVRAVVDGSRPEWHMNDQPTVLRRALPEASAQELTKMMLQTVSTGSASKAFREPNGKPYLGNIRVAGKTGTLSRQEENRHYTWFVGFAPADAPQVAVAALVVNTPVWRIKGPQLARDVLRSYFAKQGHPGVSAP